MVNLSHDLTSPIESITLPIIQVNLRSPRNHPLQFLCIERFEVLPGDHLPQPFHHALCLREDAIGQSPLHHQVDVLVLVLRGHIDKSSARFQLVFSRLSERFFEDGEGQVERFRIVLQDVDETVVEGNVYRLNVADGVGTGQGGRRRNRNIVISY